MFGYIRPYVPLLRVKDNEFYRALYCGLCASTANCNGCSSTVTLSYDMAFLALVRLALSGEKIKVVKKRCLLHPLKKRNRVESNKELDLTSKIGVLLSYYKIIDNINDEKGRKRLAAILLKPFFASARKRALKGEGEEADRIIREGLAALSKLENENCKSADETSNVFGEMLSELAQIGLDGKSKIIAKNAGFAVGKWIYIADAADDAESDEENASYNPILSLYGKNPTKEQTEDIFLALALTRERLEAALDLIDYKEEDEFYDKEDFSAYFSDELRALIENIIRKGIPEAERKIINSKTHQKDV